MKTARVAGIVGACVVFAACSDLSDDIGDGDTGGSGASGDTSESGASGDTGGSGASGDTSMIGTGGHEDGRGGSEATGGSTMAEAGSESGGTGGTMPPTCEEDCHHSGLTCDVDTLTCICPAETPDTCPGMRCTNVMDDDDHCGDCDACPATSVCNAGACSAVPEAIYLTNGGISSLVLSGDTLYWAEGGGVLSMAITGGPVTQVDQGHVLSGVYELVIDSTNLYAIDEVPDETLPRLYRIPLTGGSPERVVTEADRAYINDVAVQAGVLYYTVGNQVKSVPANATDATGTVVASPAASEYVSGVAVDGALLFWSSAAANLQPPSFNVEGDLILGGNRRTLGSTQEASYYGQASLTTDGARVYWANGATLQRRVYDASTPQETIANAHGPQITAFAVNATTAYFASSDPYGLNPDDRLEKATFGAKPQAIARHQGPIYSLVIGESGVYWASGNKIMRADL